VLASGEFISGSYDGILRVEEKERLDIFDEVNFLINKLCRNHFI
jgi:hypothetical protein